MEQRAKERRRRRLWGEAYDDHHELEDVEVDEGHGLLHLRDNEHCAFVELRRQLLCTMYPQHRQRTHLVSLGKTRSVHSSRYRYAWLWLRSADMYVCSSCHASCLQRLIVLGAVLHAIGRRERPQLVERPLDGQQALEAGEGLDCVGRQYNICIWGWGVSSRPGKMSYDPSTERALCSISSNVSSPCMSSA